MSQEGLIRVSCVSSIAIDNRAYVSQKSNMLLSLASEGLMTRFGNGPMGELRRVAGLSYSDGGWESRNGSKLD